MPSPKLKLKELLEVLARHEVAFVVVGGVGAVLQGAPVTTFDLDVVYDVAPENRSKLVEALIELEARYREQPSRQPCEADLAFPGHHLLMTKCGPLDVLGAVEGGRDYQALKSSVVLIDLPAIGSIQVLDLRRLIELKEESGREKDRLILPILRRLYEEKHPRDPGD